MPKLELGMPYLLRICAKELPVNFQFCICRYGQIKIDKLYVLHVVFIDLVL